MILFIIALALAASPATPPAPPPPNCEAREFRQLDFWVGRWEVFDTALKTRIASSDIERIMHGCAIRESYSSPGAPGGPYEGTSYSSYDRKDGRWHQMYVDNHGSVTWFDGALDGKALAMTAPGRGGSIQKMVYTPYPDGSVTQVGTVSIDGGKTWTPGYDYTYRRARK